MVVTKANKKSGPATERFTRWDAVLLVAALLVAAGVLYYYLSVQNRPQSLPQVASVSGSLISGFPQGFVLNGMNPVESSAQSYPDGSKLWSASFSSSLSPREILSAYKNLFGFVHWQITQSTASAIFAQNGGTQVGVTVQKTAGGSQILLSVLQK